MLHNECNIIMSRMPIVVILGATGTGKSKLAVKIAKKFCGEIISADSMQVYEGLSIVSNKITMSEREGVPHYLLDICKPTDRFSVIDFRNRALIMIDDMRKRGKLPIIVGGTTYYVESVLWNTLMEAPPEKLNEDTLMFHRRRVIKDAAKLQEYRSKTYKKTTFDSTTEEKDLQSVAEPAKRQLDNHLVEDVEAWCRNIVKLENAFEDLIKDTVSQLRMDSRYYRRTFYRLPKIQNQPDTQDSESKESSIRSTNGAEMSENLSIDLIVEVEKRLLSQLLLHMVKGFSIFLEEMIDSEGSANTNVIADVTNVIPSVWNTENMDRILLRSSGSITFAEGKEKEDLVPRYTSFDAITNDHGVRDRWKKLLEICGGEHLVNLENDQKMDIIEKCRNIMNEMQKIVYQLIEMRVKRLTLVRIIDDENMFDYDNESLHSELKLVDDRTAYTLHPNDRRKVIRAIQLYMSTGKTISELRKEQERPVVNPTTGDEGRLDEHGLSLRYPNALVFWLHCDQDVLDERLKRRVDEMLSNGLVDELQKFHEEYNLARLKDDREMDYTKGLFQLIGLKEFHSYLMLSAEERQSKVGLRTLRIAVDRLKRTNIQYSKNQNRHVLNKFINVPDFKQVPFLFELDCSDPEKEDQEVDKKALTLVENYLNNEGNSWWYPYTPMARVSADLGRYTHGKFVCDRCQQLFTNQYQLSVHNASRSHRKRVYNEKVHKLRETLSKVDRPKCRRSDSEEDIFVDIPWEEWNLN